MDFRANKAVKRGAVVKPGSNYKAPTSGEGNVVRFIPAGPDSNVAVTAVGDAVIGANTKGTGTEGVPTAIAEMKKQKLGISLPANY